MSVQYDRTRHRRVVRWYKADRQRSRRFAEEPAARRFDAERASAKALARDATTAAHELMLPRARINGVER
jgi:hypothetical protein